VTRGQLPQRAGSLGLNGGGAAAAVPPLTARGICGAAEEKALTTAEFGFHSGNIQERLVSRTNQTTGLVVGN